MTYWKFVGQSDEFITGADGNGVPGRDLTQAEFEGLAPDAQKALVEHIQNNPHPIYVQQDDSEAPVASVAPGDVPPVEVNPLQSHNIPDASQPEQLPEQDQ